MTQDEYDTLYGGAQSTPAGRQLREWAADKSAEIRSAADGLAAALWACAGNPPSDALSAILIERRNAFYALVGSLPAPLEIIGTRQSSAL